MALFFILMVLNLILLSINGLLPINPGTQFAPSAIWRSPKGKGYFIHNTIHNPPFITHKPSFLSSSSSDDFASPDDPNKYSSLSSSENLALMSSLKSRISEIKASKRILTTAFLNGNFTSTSYPLPTYVRRISYANPHVLFGLFNGGVGILDVQKNIITSFEETTRHAQYRDGFDEDKASPQLNAIHGDFDGGGVTAAQFGHDGKWAYTGGREGNVVVWNATRGALTEQQVINLGPVVSNILSGLDPEQRDVLLTACTDESGTLSVYKRLKPTLPYELSKILELGNPVTSAAWSENEDGSKDYSRVWVGTSDGSLRQVGVDDLETGFEVKVSKSGVRAIAVTNDEEGNDVVYVGDSSGLMFYVAVGVVSPLTPPHREAVVSMALAGDNSVLLSGSRDGSVRVWDNKEGDGKYIIGPMKVWLSGVEVDGNIVVSDGADNMVVKHEFFKTD